MSVAESAYATGSDAGPPSQAWRPAVSLGVPALTLYKWSRDVWLGQHLFLAGNWRGLEGPQADGVQRIQDAAVGFDVAAPTTICRLALRLDRPGPRRAVPNGPFTRAPAGVSLTTCLYPFSPGR